MKKIWGIPVTNLNWTNEDGSKFNPDELYPVVDYSQNRIYGIRKQDETDVVVVQSYHKTAQRGGALGFARTVWGNPENWEKPDIDGRLITCLGESACHACDAASQGAADFAPNWRVSPLSGDTRLFARLLSNPGDPINESLSETHVLALVEHIPDDEDNIQKELTRRAIALFGRLVDVSNECIEGPMAMAYDVRLGDPVSAEVEAHYRRPESDIYIPQLRPFGNR
jgi:hypothetical protein